MSAKCRDFVGNIPTKKVLLANSYQSQTANTSASINFTQNLKSLRRTWWDTLCSPPYHLINIVSWNYSYLFANVGQRKDNEEAMLQHVLANFNAIVNFCFPSHCTVGLIQFL